MWHVSEGVQTFQFVPTQLPREHDDDPEHRLPSSHAVPFALFECVHAPETQASLVHGLKSLQLGGKQTPKAALETRKMPVANPIEGMDRPSRAIAIADTRYFSMVCRVGQHGRGSQELPTTSRR